jgi:hypothetical protein
MELVLDYNKRYTYADYLTWWDDKRRELIHGFIKKMSPAPLSERARISFRLVKRFDAIIEKNKGNAKYFMRRSMFAFLKRAKRQMIRWIRWCSRIFALFAICQKLTGVAAAVHRI